MHRHTWYLPGRTLTLVCLLTGFLVLFFELLDVLQPRAPIPKGSRHGVAQAAHFGDVSFTPIASNLDKPLAITHAGDGSGRLFIGLQEGQIVVFDGTQVLVEPFLDISGLVSCCGDQGLLGVAFHPDHKQNGFVYINYTDLTGITIIARYTVSAHPNRVDPNSAAHILEILSQRQDTMVVTLRSDRTASCILVSETAAWAAILIIMLRIWAPC